MKGFTLVELLVALLVLALLGAAGVALLGQGVTTAGALERRSDELGQLVRARALLKADLEQAALRPTRDRYGQQRPAFAGGPDQLAFVRRGWENPAGLARGSLQRVEYRLVGDRLERRASLPDGAEPGPPQLLLTGVQRFRFAYFRGSGWEAAFSDPAALPRAVAVTLATDRHDELRQLFLLPTEAAAP